MIYLFKNPDNSISWVKGDRLSDKDKEKGFPIDELPPQETEKGKIAKLQFNFDSHEVWWEYEDKPIDKDEEIQILKNRLQSTEDALMFLMDMQMMGGM